LPGRVFYLSIFVLLLFLSFLSQRSLTGAAKPSGLSHADSLWVESYKGITKKTKNDLTLTVDERTHNIFYNGKISFPYTIHFTEPVGEGKNTIMVKFNYFPKIPEFPDGFMGGLLLTGDGYAVKMAANQASLIQGVPSYGNKNSKSRNWEILVTKENAILKLNGEQVEQYVFAKIRQGSEIQDVVPFFTIQSYAKWIEDRPEKVKSTRVLENIHVTTSAVSRPVQLYQVPRIIDSKSFITFVAGPKLAGPDDLAAKQISLLNREVIRQGESRDLHFDPVIAIVSDRVQCCWNAAGLGWAFINENNLKANSHVLAHELAHNLGCALGNCYDRDNFAWLWEGYASYLGQRALNMYLGAPVWNFDVAVTPPYGFPPKWKEGGYYDPPLGLSLNSVPKKYGGRQAGEMSAYYKGYTLFQIFSEKYNHMAIQNMVKWSIAQTEQSGEYYFLRLSRFAGMSPEELNSFKPGWFTEGAYNTFKTSDAKDSDGDGLVDFQEKIWNTNIKKRDTDGDGISDYEERVYGSDPTDKNSWVDVLYKLKKKERPYFANRPGASGKSDTFQEWVFDGNPVDFPDQNSFEVSGKNSIMRMKLQANGEYIVGALWHPNLDSGATLTRLVVRDGDNNEFVGTYRWDEIVDHIYKGSRYPDISKENFRVRCTVKGCEFIVKRSVFSSGSVSKNWQIGIIRSSRKIGIDTQFQLETAFTLDARNKFSKNRARNELFSASTVLDPLWESPRRQSLFGGLWILDGDPQDIPGYGSAYTKVATKKRRGSAPPVETPAQQKTGSKITKFMMQFDVTHFAGGVWNDKNNLPSGKNETYELKLEDKNKNSMTVFWENGETQKVIYKGIGTGKEKKYTKEDFLFTCTQKGCEFYIPSEFFDMKKNGWQIFALFRRFEKIDGKEYETGLPLHYELLTFKISEAQKKNEGQAMRDRDKQMEERRKLFKERYNVQ